MKAFKKKKRKGLFLDKQKSTEEASTLCWKNISDRFLFIDAGRQVNGCGGERGILGADMNILCGVSRKYAIPKKGFLIMVFLGV